MNSTVKSSIEPDTSRLSHAYIADGVFVDTLAMSAVCSAFDSIKPCLACAHCDKASRHIHPDIITVDKLPDKREILVDQIRELKRDILVVPNEAEKKVYIINDADSMNTSAQNAFLRMLEDPPSHTVFILRTTNPLSLLRTVRSRCVVINPGVFTGESDFTVSDSVLEIAEHFLASLTSGNAALVDTMFRLDKLERPDFSAFLTFVRERLVTQIRENDYAARETDHTTEARKRLETLSQAEQIIIKAGEMLDLNVSTGHIAGMICASLLDC